MHRFILATASATALMTSSAALAQADVAINQTGLDHTVSIDQVEDVLNTITVTQAGNLQSVQVRQTAPGGNNNTVTSQGVTGGLGENTIEARQTGSDNIVTITQKSMTNIALATQDGSGNDLFIDQGFADGTGADAVANNTLTVNQNMTTSGSGNRAVINQIGDGFDLTIDQEGSGMVNEITQM
jgi:Curlin associated repeat